VKSYFTTKANT